MLVKGIDFWGTTGEEVMPTLEAEGLKPEKINDTMIRAKSGDVTTGDRIGEGLIL